MNNQVEDLQRQLREVRAEVAGLRRTIVSGFIGLGAVLLVALCAPGLGVLAVGLAVVVVVVGTIGAVLGSITGKAIRKARGEDQS